MEKEDIKNTEFVLEEKSLEQRLGVTEESENIIISSLGVVSGRINMVRNLDDYGDINNKEYTFNEFVKKLDKNIEFGWNSIKYDKASKSFYLIVKDSPRHRGGTYRGGYWVTIPIARKLVLDDIAMENYAFGKLDKFTSVLDELCKKSELKDKIDTENERKEKEKKEIIIKAENSPSDLSLLEAKSYYNYLKDLDKQNIKDISLRAGAVGAIASPGVAAWVITSTTIFDGHPVGIIGGAMAAFATTMVEDLVITFTDRNDKYLTFKVFNYIKEWTKDISEKVKKVRINRLKEKNLIKLYSVDKVVIPNSVTVTTEEIKTEKLDLDDHIMKELDNVVDKTVSINSKDRDILLREVKSLLINYIDRKTSIMSSDKSVIDSNTDSLIALRNDMCSKLAKIEIKINDIKNKELKAKKIADEGKLLTDKIEKIESFESEESKPMQRIRIY